MKKRRSIVAVLASAIVMTLTGCGGLSTIEMHGDYLVYDTPAAMAAQATIVIEATVVGKEPMVLTPRYDPDNPDDPYHYVPDEVRDEDIARDAGIPAEAVSLRVDAVYFGDATVGDTVVFVQTGGVVGDVRYRVDGEPDLMQGQKYLLFGTDSFDGRFAVLGGASGAFQASGEVFLASSEHAPAERLTRAQVRELFRG